MRILTYSKYRDQSFHLEGTVEIPPFRGQRKSGPFGLRGPALRAAEGTSTGYGHTRVRVPSPRHRSPSWNSPMTLSLARSPPGLRDTP